MTICDGIVFFIADFSFLGQWWSGTDFVLYMQHPEDQKYFGKEHLIAIFNHRSDIDWLIGWLITARFNMIGVRCLKVKKSASVIIR